jgi:hypothetical protein
VRPWHETRDSEGLTFTLPTSGGVRAAMTAPVVTAVLHDVIDHRAPYLLWTGFAVGLSGLLFVANSRWRKRRLYMDRHLVQVLGPRKQSLARVAMLDLASFAGAGETTSAYWPVVVTLVDGTRQSLPFGMGSKVETGIFATRLNAALAQLRTPQGYRE